MNRSFVSAGNIDVSPPGGRRRRPSLRLRPQQRHSPRPFAPPAAAPPPAAATLPLRVRRPDRTRPARLHRVGLLPCLQADKTQIKPGRRPQSAGRLNAGDQKGRRRTARNQNPAVEDHIFSNAARHPRPHASRLRAHGIVECHRYPCSGRYCPLLGRCSTGNQRRQERAEPPLVSYACPPKEYRRRIHDSARSSSHGGPCPS